MISSELSAVTALYDVGRERFGRDTGVYIGWLNQTLRLPIGFTIFLDPTISPEAIDPKPSDRIIQIPLEQFRPFTWSEAVKEITSVSSNSDLTFTLPRYSMLVMSKFDMLSRTAEELGSEGRLLWIDAGLSRFFKQELSNGSLSEKRLNSLRNAAFSGSITPQCARALRQGRISNLVGTSARLVSAGDLYMTAEGAVEAAERLYDMVEQRWLPAGLWDNEQVALGCLLAEGWPNFQAFNVTTDYASLLSELFGLPRYRSGVRRVVDTWVEKITKTAG